MTFGDTDSIEPLNAARTAQDGSIRSDFEMNSRSFWMTLSERDGGQYHSSKIKSL